MKNICAAVIAVLIFSSVLDADADVVVSHEEKIVFTFYADREVVSYYYDGRLLAAHTHFLMDSAEGALAGDDRMVIFRRDRQGTYLIVHITVGGLESVNVGGEENSCSEEPNRELCLQTMFIAETWRSMLGIERCLPSPEQMSAPGRSLEQYLPPNKERP